MIKENQKKYTFRFKESLINHLRIVAELEDKTMSEIVRASVISYIDDWHKHKQSSLLERDRYLHKMKQNLDSKKDDSWDSGSFMFRSYE